MKELTNHISETNHFDQYPKPVTLEKEQQCNDGNLDCKRKKSLPVKKLLEIERSNAAIMNSSRKSSDKTPGTKMKFNCDRCGEKYEANKIMEHIRECDSSLDKTSQFISMVDIATDEEKDNNGVIIPTATDCKEETNLLNRNDTSSNMMLAPSFSPSARTLSNTSSILGSLEKMVESSFKGNFKINNNPSRDNCRPTEASDDQNVGPKDQAKSMLQRLGLDEDSHVEHPSRSNRAKSISTFSDTNLQRSHSGRAQSPFSSPRSPNRIYFSDQLLATTTTSISSNLKKDMFLHGCHQPLTALRKLVENNRNVTNNEDQKTNEETSSDVLPSSDSPCDRYVHIGDHEVAGHDGPDSSHYRKENQSTSPTDKNYSLSASPDSTVSNSANPVSNTYLKEQSQVSYGSKPHSFLVCILRLYIAET